MSNARLQRWTPLSRQRCDAEPGSRALDQRDKAIELFRTDMARLLAAVESVDAGCGPTFDEVCADAKAASEQLLARLRALTGEDWRTVPSLFAYRYKRATPYGGHAAEIVAADRSPLDAFGEYADGRGAAGSWLESWPPEQARGFCKISSMVVTSVGKAHRGAIPSFLMPEGACAAKTNLIESKEES